MFGRNRKPRREKNVAEAQHDAQLIEAEREYQALEQRKDKALRDLDARHQRNHWRESIERMIQGAT